MRAVESGPTHPGPMTDPTPAETIALRFPCACCGRLVFGESVCITGQTDEAKLRIEAATRLRADR
jgi:hypothetical protein